MGWITNFWKRLRGDAPTLDRADISSGRWLKRYARHVLVSTDALLFLGGGIAAGLFAEFFKTVETNGEGLMVALTAIGFAALAVVLTALAIFVSLVNDAYLRILARSEKEKKGGVGGYLFPYLSAGLISAITTIFGAVGSVVYEVFTAAWAKAVILGLEVGFVVWASWAVFQIIVDVALHGLNRYRVAAAVLRSSLPPNIRAIIGEDEDEGEDEE